MKKLLFLFILPALGFSQIIIETKIEYDEKRNIHTKTTRHIDVTKIKDKYISIDIDDRGTRIEHIMSTTKFKDLKLSGRINKKNWNVLDGGNLIRLRDEVDIINFFFKYGYELDDRSMGNISNSGNIIEQLVGWSSDKKKIILKNINN